jgi:hypothetical protein
MSKRISITFTCPQCKKVTEEEIFRTIWGEKPDNRDLVFSDKVNRITCSGCGQVSFINTSLMYTNVELRFAVWYEPRPDPHIDAEIPAHNEFAARNPGASYLAKAPRVRDWNEFKAMIEKFEKGELVTESRLLKQTSASEQRPIQQGRGCLLLFGIIIFAVVSAFALVAKAAWR